MTMREQAANRLSPCGSPRLGQIAVNRFDQVFKLKRPIMPRAVDEECRRSIDAAAHAAGEIVPDSLGESALVQRALKILCRQSQLIGELQKKRQSECVLILIDQIMHFPKLAA